MKKGFFFILFLGILFSSLFNCEISNSYWPDTENSQIKDKLISEKESREYSRESKNNITFLGLNFGMTLPETFNRLIKLKSQNIISDMETCYGILGAEYEMNYGEYSNKGKMYCFYNDNKLQELQIDTLEQRSGNLLDLFVSKYGDCDYFADNELNQEYHWIKGNQHITLYSFADSDRLLIRFEDTTGRIKNEKVNLLINWGLIAEEA